MEKIKFAFDLMKRIIFKPKEAFSDVDSKPFILGLFLSFAALYTIATAFQWNLIIESVIKRANDQAIPVTADSVYSFMIVSYIAAIMILALTPFIKTLFTHGIATAYGIKGKLTKTLAITLRAYFVVIFGELIMTVAKLILHDNSLKLAPTLLVPDGFSNQFITQLLGYFDVFTLWYLALAVYGMIKVYGLTRKQASLAVILPFAGFVAVSLLPLAK